MRQPPQRRRTLLTALAIALLALTGLVAPLRPAPALALLDPGYNPIHLTLLGDSYSAGNGAGSYYGPEESYRSYKNWAHNYARWLRDQGVPAKLDNLAHSGDTTTHVLEGADGRPSQISQMSTDTDVVMLTIGGNDAKFTDIVQDCFAFPSGSECRDSVEYAEGKMNDLEESTRRIFEKIDENLPDDAQVILVGYPRLATDTDYIIRFSEIDMPIASSTYDAGQKVRALSDLSRTIQSKVVSEWNAGHPSLKVTYIDNVIDTFSGHEPDPRTGIGIPKNPKSFSEVNRNPARWINEFAETEGRFSPASGRTISKSSFLDKNPWYHPNITGHEKIAELIEEKVGIPKPANSGRGAPRGGDRAPGEHDIVLMIEASGPAHEDLEPIRSQIQSIVDNVNSRSSSTRFAVVSYRIPSISPDNQLPKIETGFTASSSEIEQGVARIYYPKLDATLGDQAWMYGGLMNAADLDWRSNAKKSIFVLGGSSPQDPDPSSGQTLASVSSSLYARGPITVHAINIAGQLESAPTSDLVGASEGNTYHASTMAEAPDRLREALDYELTKPYATIQEPQTIKIGDSLTLDARGSYSPSGRRITSYEWDFNGDRVYDETTTDGMVTHTFNEEYNGVAAVRVTQDDGKRMVGTVPLIISDDGDSTPRESDNCPDTYNYSQSDYDGDGIGDECDPEPGYPEPDPNTCIVGVNCPGDGGSTPPPAPEPSPEPTEHPAPPVDPPAWPTTPPEQSPTTAPEPTPEPTAPSSPGTGEPSGGTTTAVPSSSAPPVPSPSGFAQGPAPAPTPSAIPPSTSADPSAPPSTGAGSGQQAAPPGGSTTPDRTSPGGSPQSSPGRGPLAGTGLGDGALLTGLAALSLTAGGIFLLRRQHANRA